MGSLEKEQRAQIRALLGRGFSSADVARRLGVPMMRVAAVKAHITMGTYEDSGRPKAPPAAADAALTPRASGVDAVPNDTRAVSIGIDVAEERKGLDLVALDRDRRIVASHGRLTINDVVAITMSLRPAVVCIDSPSGWSTSGRSRLAERELARIGIQSYRTGPDPGDHPFYGWMRVGFEIFGRLSSAYPRYGGREVAGTAAEIFPHASACLLAGELRSTATRKEDFRRSVLDQAKVAEHQLPTLDRVDAALGALTGLIALEGRASAVGDPSEGMILLPVPDVPGTPLPLGRPGGPSLSPSRPTSADMARAGGRQSRGDPVIERSAQAAAPLAVRRFPRVRARGSLDYQHAAAFVAAVPDGFWTSYKDVATAAGNPDAAMAIGGWLKQSGGTIPRYWRVIRSDGFVPDGFVAHVPGLPTDSVKAREWLQREGVPFSVSGRASPGQRFRYEHWRSSAPSRPVVSAPITPPTPAGIQLGVTVCARDLDSDEKRIWTLVARTERDPDAGKLSIDSPIGRALVGHDVGDTVSVAAPRGERLYVIEDVSR